MLLSKIKLLKFSFYILDIVFFLCVRKVAHTHTQTHL